MRPVTHVSEDARTELAEWLSRPEAAPALAVATSATGRFPDEPVAAAAAVRRELPDLPVDRAAAALEQAELRLLAQQRYGIDSSALLLTRDGLEQATRPEVAARRASLLSDAGALRVIDLTAGLGFDAHAFAAAGLDVTAVERNTVTSAYLAHNCPTARVIVGDATDPDLLADLLAGLSATDVVFVDPARRDPLAPRGSNLRARPERDPGRWSPPWQWIENLPHPRVTAKVAPAFRPPSTWHAEWISVNRNVVECSVFSWPVFAAARRAVVWTDSGPVVIDADDNPIGAGQESGRWIHELDPAITGAEAVHSVLQSFPELRVVDDESSWLTSDDELSLPILRSYEVVEELLGSTTSQRRQLDRLGVAAMTVKSRDAGVAPHTALRELDRREGNDHVLVITRRSGRTVRFLCRQAHSRSV